MLSLRYLLALTVPAAVVVGLADPHASSRPASEAPAAPDSAFLASFKWRNIGPDRG
ncbi:MAG: hypothetical protein H7247_03935, partial [Polaromonas sp.]|nr:hypothetical protein [Gemmatimonadaceae bacterium]